jgi:hypothetical protein
MTEIENKVKDFCSLVLKSPYVTLNLRKTGEDFELSESKIYNKRYKTPCDYL